MAITAKQRKWRRAHLCASDLPVVMGCTPYRRTPADIYWDKVGPDIEDKPTDSMAMGTALEPGVLALAADRLGVGIRRIGSRVAKDGQGRGVFGAHLDALIAGRKAAIEAKVVTPYNPVYEMYRRPFGADGTDEIPDDMICQAQDQAYVCQLDVVYVAVLLLGRGALNVYEVQRDDEYIDIAVATGMAWWRRHVLAKQPPNGEPMPWRYVQAMPRKEGLIVQVDETDEIHQIAAAWEQAKVQVKAAENARDALLVPLVERCNQHEAEALQLDAERVFYYRTTTTQSIDTKRLRAERPEIANEYAKQTTRRTPRIGKPPKT
jgi:predicted phage-related endonuclease